MIEEFEDQYLYDSDLDYDTEETGSDISNLSDFIKNIDKPYDKPYMKNNSSNRVKSGVSNMLEVPKCDARRASLVEVKRKPTLKF